LSTLRISMYACTTSVNADSVLLRFGHWKPFVLCLCHMPAVDVDGDFVFANFIVGSMNECMNC
jgi:hypothetical protein